MIKRQLVIRIVLALASLLVCPFAEASTLRSSSIEELALVRTSPSGARLRIHAALAFVSAAGDSMSAANAMVDLELPHQKKRAYRCAILRYEFHAGFLICDNRSHEGMKSIALNADLQLTEI